MVHLNIILSFLLVSFSSFANVSSSLRPVARPAQCSSESVFFDRSVINDQIENLKNQITQQRRAHEMMIANSTPSSSDMPAMSQNDASYAMEVENNRGLMCDISSITDEVVNYAGGACNFDQVVAACQQSHIRAQNANGMTSSIQPDGSQEVSTIREAYNRMVSLFNMTIDANDSCSNEANAAIANNPICLNSLTVFAYKRIAEDYISRCHESQIDAIYNNIGDGLTQFGNTLQSSVINPHCESRGYEHSIANSIITFENYMADLENPINLRQPASANTAPRSTDED